MVQHSIVQSRLIPSRFVFSFFSVGESIFKEFDRMMWTDVMNELEEEEEDFVVCSIHFCYFVMGAGGSLPT